VLVEAADRAAADPGDREALRAHGAALDTLAAAGAGLLSGRGRGLTEDALLRVRSALHAASLDRAAREDFAAGRLTTEPAPVGFGAITATPKARPKPKAAAKPKPKPKPKRPSPAARKRVDRAEDRVRAARAALEQALRELDEARAGLD